MSLAFAFYFLLTFIGIQMNVHYCHGHIKSIEFFLQSYSCCCGEMNSSNGCCSNETHFIQLEDEETILLTEKFHFENWFTLIPENNFLYSIDNLPEEDQGIQEVNNPPPQKNPKWVLNCSLTYYG